MGCQPDVRGGRMNREGINKKLRTVSIRGKDYVEVAERVMAFWELFPGGNIDTAMVSNDGKLCVFKAIVSANGASASGWAFEERKGAINSTSYIENCETSAVGRALGFFGIGSAAAIASADEMRAAMAQKPSGKPEPNKDAPKAETAPQAAPDAQIERIRKLKQQCLDAGVNPEGVASWYEARFGAKPLNKLTAAEKAETIAHYVEVRDSARALL